MRVHELFAYLHVGNAAQAIDFYSKAFGAREKFRLTEPSGRIGHAELDFDGTTVMLSDEYPEYGIKAPQASGAAVTIHIHVDNADEVIRRAVEAGATIEMEPDLPVVRRGPIAATDSAEQILSAARFRKSLRRSARRCASAYSINPSSGRIPLPQVGGQRRHS
jgi:uncharacterized glyoxalase superfamily protein PhnB